jgi:pimeloyl-ACP methyl ester carboxylesterase
MGLVVSWCLSCRTRLLTGLKALRLARPQRSCRSAQRRRAHAGPQRDGAGGKVEYLDRLGELARLRMTTLVIGARHDTMDPVHIKQMSEWISERIPVAPHLYCPQGGHLAMCDDQQAYIATMWRLVRSLGVQGVRAKGGGARYEVAMPA